MELQAYIPAGITIVLAFGFCGLLLLMAIMLGPKRVTPTKVAPFECGSEPIGSPRARYSVKFYQVAILFLVFDIEVGFMYPWAVMYRELSFPELSGGPPGISFVGFGEMLVFVSVLVVALTYVWRKKAIGWD